MAIEIKAPVFPESVADGVIATWHKKPGDKVVRDETLVDIETDKVILEVPAVADGVLGELLKNEGDTVLSQEVLALLLPAGEATAAAPAPAAIATHQAADDDEEGEGLLSPSVRRLVSEHGLDASKIAGTGRGGRITKDDVLSFVTAQKAATQAAAPAPVAAKAPAAAPSPSSLDLSGRAEKRVPMTRLRARIAERLVQAQQTAAILTTFNEVNMKPVMELRARYKDQFEKAHGARLGFMSFFVKAAVEALKRFPSVNASIDGNDIVYHGFFDIGIAVSSPRGLVVPVLRDADQLNMAKVENGIRDFGVKAQNNQLSIEELTGGTFTISNGGVFGSLLSTPIINPPQSAILGMHKIQERPMVVDGKIEILPMMYLALSYDHRIIDGRESVSFLVAIKELLEDPARLLLEI